MRRIRAVYAQHARGDADRARAAAADWSAGDIFLMRYAFPVCGFSTLSLLRFIGVSKIKRFDFNIVSVSAPASPNMTRFRLGFQSSPLFAV